MGKPGFIDQQLSPLNAHFPKKNDEIARAVSYSRFFALIICGVLYVKGILTD